MEITNEGYFVGVRFAGTDKTYYYSTKTKDLLSGELVIVNSDGAIECATVSTAVMNASTYQSTVELKPIIRKANPTDIRIYEKNEQKAKAMMEIAQAEVNAREMPMDFIASYLSFNGEIITLVYTSTEKRVDFRELLPVLGSKLRAKVSLRQIASRDRAKMIGGIGICGLPLCCKTFLTTFESIAISKMKNQMLAINIPKYSGPCEKLMCCLAYEDETYTLEKQDFPKINQEIKLDGEIYTVNSYNVISRTVRLSNADHSDFQTFPLEDVLAMMEGKYKKKEQVLAPEKEYKLPDFNIGTKPSDNEQPNRNQNQGKNDKNNRDLQRNGDNRGNNNNRQNNRSDNRGNDRRDNSKRDNSKSRPQNDNRNRHQQNNARPQQEGNRDQRNNNHRDNRNQNRQNGNKPNNGNRPNNNPQDQNNAANSERNNNNRRHNRNRHHHGRNNRGNGGEGGEK